MKLGFIGAGNMASALARGIGEPALVFDVDQRRAEALAAAIGGQVAGSNAELAAEADAVVLCHKPQQLEAVAAEAAGAHAVVSILGGVPLEKVEAAYPDRPAYRFMPSIPVEVRRGVVCYAPGSRAKDGPEQNVLDLVGRTGTVVHVPEHLIDAATAVMSCGPAFLALVVESIVDAGVRQGLPPDQASLMAVETMAGTAAVLTEGDRDAAALRRRVTSPGGMTERGLAVLEDAGIRAAFDDAVDAVVNPR